MAISRSVPRILAELPKLPPQAMRDGTAGRILGAGLLLFARNGYHGTSIRDIGEELELKAANLYAYFKSKEHLLAELVRIGHEEHHARLRKALIESAPGPLEQVKALVRAHVLSHAEYAMLATVANTEMHALSPELVAPARVLRSESEAMFHDVVRRGIELGDFDPPNEWVTVAAIGGMGMRVAAWYQPELGIAAQEIADVHAELAVRMLGGRAAKR
ncbi:MAG: TetR family transcriptional regulator [Polyangia bacterium]